MNPSHNCGCSPVKPCREYSYGQFGVQSNPPSNTDIPMFVLSQEGNEIVLSDSKIILSPGYLYLIDFIFLATPGVNSYMQVTPKIDSIPRLLYSFLAPSGAGSPNTSASGSFTVPVSGDNTVLSFYLTYPDTVRSIDISGIISVTMLHKIRNTIC